MEVEWRAGVFAHEIGHILGLKDRNEKNAGGVMYDEKLFYIMPLDVWFITQSFVTGRLNTSGNYPPAKPVAKNLTEFIDNIKN